jgi:hypothetical protein
VKLASAAGTRWVVSGVVVAVLAVQAIAAFGLTPGPVEKSPFLWPFLDYPMYSTPHYEGDGIPRYRVLAVTADGEELEVTPAALGSDFWIYRNAFLFSFFYPGMRDELEPGVELLERRHGVTVLEVRLENRPLLLTREGTTEGPLALEGVARRDAADQPWQWEAP